MRRVTIVPTGTANTASVVAALTRLGAEVGMATPRDVDSSAGVVLPGVGSFGAAMGRIDSLGLATALGERIEAGRPTLAVCVGMQVLGRGSEESPGSAGLNLLEATVGRFPHGVTVPQMGWNRVEPGPDSRFVEAGWAYFANSYRIERAPEGWVGSRTDHGGEFLSALEKGDVLACQFHPELSGQWGARLLDRWLRCVEMAA
ncbi:MAG TPA: imidazole glycerol phosphate synthase subunit HisH [Acidimicrobiia bacterium]|nr:imidazole glycerol phosphate synthase subunit HisH [Acidimicrobiia bacterium]